MNQAIAKKPKEPVTGLTQAQIQLVKRTVAKNATDDELLMFLHLARKYKLDPLAREMYFIKQSEKDVVMMTGRDGFLKIAQSDPNYQGLQAMAVRENDNFSIDVQTGDIKHSFTGKNRGAITGAWAVAYHAKRKPVVCYVEFSEYDRSADEKATSRDGREYTKRGSPTWKKYPSAMIQKVAEVFVLRRQFNISGLVSEEEVGTDANLLAAGADQPTPPNEIKAIIQKSIEDCTDGEKLHEIAIKVMEREELPEEDRRELSEKAQIKGNKILDKKLL